jgi:carbon-monoxide dehydrogenase medium subunit
MPDAALREFHRPADEAAALELLNRRTSATAPAWIGPRVPDKLYGELEAVVDLSRLDLAYIRKDGDLIRIGALTPLQALADSPLLRDFAGGIVAEAASLSCGSALRQAATIGGALSLHLADPGDGQAGPPELRLALLALDAGLVFAGGDENRMLGSISDGLTRPGGGFVSEVVLVTMDKAEVGALMRLARSPRDQAIVAAAAVVNLRGGALNPVRLAVSGAGDRPMRLVGIEQALAGQALTPERLGEVEVRVAALVNPSADYLGGSQYRREMAGLLARRALEAAAARSEWVLAHT